MVKKKIVRLLTPEELELVSLWGSVKPEDYPREIAHLRKELALGQAEFAQVLGVSHPSVSAWETGKYRPSAEIFIKLGNLASYPMAIWFWREGGIDSERMIFMFSRFFDRRGRTKPVTELSIGQAARILRVTEDRVSELLKAGKLIGRSLISEGGRKGGLTIIEYNSLIDYLSKNKTLG